MPIIRSTTGGVLRGYRSNLMNSFISLNKARNTVLTQRNFNSYAEDPATAAQAFKLRKSRMQAESQYNICDDTYRKYQQGFSALQSVSEILDTKTSEPLKTLEGVTLESLNDPEGSARGTLSKAISQMSETIVQCLNTKYGDNFVFAGADGQNVPFEIKDNRLYYRGVPVDASVPNVVQENGAPLQVDADGNLDANGGHYIRSESISTFSAADFDAMDPADQPQVLRDATGAAVRVDADGNIDPSGQFVMTTGEIETISQADYEKAQEDVEKLKYLADEEKYFVDIGLGFQENIKGELIESSGFNAALNGLTFLGYGTDADGDPKNIYSIVQRLSEIAGRVTEDQDWTREDYEEFHGLVGKLEDARATFKVEFVDMSAATEKLKKNLELLEDGRDTLVEQYSGLEDVDMAEAITSFIWAQYCYNAALKVGNSILSESLMDYLT